MADHNDKIVRTPSVQHLAYHVGFDRARVASRIRETYDRTGRPSYNPTRKMFPVIMRVDKGDTWVRRQIDLLAEDTKVWAEVVSACDLLLEYRKLRQPAWWRGVSSRMFQLPTGLIVPVNPAGLLKSADLLVRLVWLQLWKTKRLDEIQLAFFYYVLERSFFILELEDIELDFVSLARPDGADDRLLEVLNRAQMPRITDAQFRELCMVFHEEFDRYMRETGRPAPGAPSEVPMGVYGEEPGQQGLF